MHSSRKITYFTLFSAINLAVMGVAKTEPFYAMLKLASPFDVELEKYNFALLTLSLTVSIIFISVLIQVIAEQFSISNYILVRTTRKATFFRLWKNTLKNVSVIFLMKILSDLLFSQINGGHNVLKALTIAISTMVTLVIWILFIYLLLEAHMRVKWVYFLMMLGVILLQYASAYIPVCSIFVFGSPKILESPLLWISAKAIILLLLLRVNVKMYNGYEHLGMVSEL